MKSVRVGAAQGFYGDTFNGALMNVQYGDIDYLSFDCLAELTMAILAKDKQKREDTGYTKDIGIAMNMLLPLAKEKGIKILTNAGGINPIGAQEEVLSIARELGLNDLKVAVITGDNILPHIDELIELGMDLEDLETGRPFTKEVQQKLLFANAYIGSQPLVEALRQGADVVISGRSTDTAQFLAPLIYEFGWEKDDWNRLASGIFMGHLLECSAQSTGGNFSGRWQDIENFENIGYPIAEMYENGEFIVTKPKDSGGLVSVDTVKEQMLYEIHDPSAYITPDVVVDITGVTLEQVGKDEVKVKGVKGKESPKTLKAVMGFENGYMGQALIGYSWPDAFEKAKSADRIIRNQIEQRGLPFDEIRTDFVGYNSLHGPLAKLPQEDINELYVRIVVKAQDKRVADGFRRLIPPLALNGPPTLSAVGNIPTRQLLGMWSTLIDREWVEANISVSIKEVEAYAKSDS
ncbi:acyclic terpene utilization AtuA family protein [Peribacillus sp. NPDC097206]|uniref:acyclic terpene utilization AtuA family protein n=1 Tax=unclassified Peribacillus TaxID=2675266 RepID=UPI0038273166